MEDWYSFMISNHDWKLLKKFSEKGFDFSKAEQTKHSKKIKSVEEGIVTITSGYLAICDSQEIEAYGQLPFSEYDSRGRRRINLNNPTWSIPNMMQGDGFVSFRNLWGDGCYAVLSSKNRFYVETDCPTMAESLAALIKQGDVEEKKGSRVYRLEGLVGVGCGSMVLTDPNSNHIQQPAEEYHPISTILPVTPGVYVCRFIEGGKKLAIRKKS